MLNEMINETNYQLTEQEWIDLHKQMRSSMSLPDYESTWGPLALADFARKNLAYVRTILQEFLFDFDQAEQKYLIQTLILLYEGYSKSWSKKLWNKQTRSFDAEIHLQPITADNNKTIVLINYLFENITQQQEPGFKAFYSCVFQLLEQKTDYNTIAQLLSLFLHSAFDKADLVLKTGFISSFIKSNINASDGRLLAYMFLSLVKNADDPICLQFIRDFFVHPDLKIDSLDIMFAQAWHILKSVTNNAAIAKVLLLNNYLKFISTSENSIKDARKSSIAKYIISLTESSIPTAPNQKMMLISYCSNIKNVYSALYEAKPTVATSFFSSVFESDPLEKIKSFMRKLGARDNADLITLPTTITWQKIIDPNAEFPDLSLLIPSFWGHPIKGITTEKRIDAAISIYLKCKELLNTAINDSQRKKILTLTQQAQNLLKITLRLPEKKITEVLLNNLQALYKKGWRYQPNSKDFYARAEKELLILLGGKAKDLNNINFIEFLSAQNLITQINAIAPFKCQSILFNACVDAFECGELLIMDKDGSFADHYMTFFLKNLRDKNGFLSLKDYDISTLAQIYYFRELTEKRNLFRKVLKTPSNNNIFCKVFPDYKNIFQELFTKGSITLSIIDIANKYIEDSERKEIKLEELNFFTEEQQSSAQSFIYDEREIIFEEKNGYLTVAPFTTTLMEAHNKQNLCGSIETAWGEMINFSHIDGAENQKRITHQLASGGAPVQSATLKRTNELGYRIAHTNQSGHTQGDAIVSYHSLSHAEKAGLYLQGTEIYILDMELKKRYEDTTMSYHEQLGELRTKPYKEEEKQNLYQEITEAQKNKDENATKSYQEQLSNILNEPHNEKEKKILGQKITQAEQNQIDMHCVCQRYTLQDFYTNFNRCSINNLNELKNLKNILTEIYTENKNEFVPLAQQALEFFFDKFQIFLDNLQKSNKKIILSSVFIKHQIGMYFQELLNSQSFKFESARAAFFRNILDNANQTILNLDYITHNSDSLNLPDFHTHQTKFNQCIESLYQLYKNAFSASAESTSILLQPKMNVCSYKYFSALFNHYLKLSTATLEEITKMFQASATHYGVLTFNVKSDLIKIAQQQSDFIMYDLDKSMRYFEWLFIGKLPHQYKIPKGLKIIIVGDTGVEKPTTVEVYTGVGKCAERLRAAGVPVLIWNTGDMGYDDGFTAANDNKFQTIYYTPLSKAKIKSATTNKEMSVLKAASPQFITRGNHDYALRSTFGIYPEITDKNKHKLIVENLTRHTYLREYHPGKISPIEFFRQEEELDLKYLHENAWFLNDISDHQVFYNDDIFIVNLDGNTFAEHALDFLEKPNACNPIDNQVYFLLEEYKIHSEKEKEVFIHNPLKSSGKGRNEIPLYISKAKLKKLLAKLQEHVSDETKKYKSKQEKTAEDISLIEKNEFLLTILKNLKDPTHGDIIILIFMAFHLKANIFIHGHNHAAYLAKSIKIDFPIFAPLKEEKAELVQDAQAENKNNQNSSSKFVFLRSHDLIPPAPTTNMKAMSKVENKLDTVADVQLVVGNGGAPSQKRKRFSKLSHFMQNHGYVELSTTPTKDPNAVKYIFYAIERDPDHPKSLCQGKSWFFNSAGDLILPKVNKDVEKFRKIIIEAYDEYIDFIDKHNTHEYALEMNLTHGNKGTHRAEDIKNFLTCNELSKFSLQQILDILKEYIIDSYKTALGKKLDEAKTYVAEALNIKQNNKQQSKPLTNPAQSSFIRKIYNKMQAHYSHIFTDTKPNDIWVALQEGFDKLANSNNSNSDDSKISSEIQSSLPNTMSM